MPTALLSVYDKTGIKEFAQELIGLGWDIISSGGTAKALSDNGIPVRDVAELVGGGAILDHRVVTLSREIHAGLLARYIDADIAELERLGIPFIDLVCVDLYPLADEIANPQATRESVIEKTDIGGPTMLSSAAKGRRIVVAKPEFRQGVIDWLKAGKPTADDYLNFLAATADAVVADYRLQSARYHSNGLYDGFVGRVDKTCRYGENAWQTPAHLLVGDSPDPLALSRFRAVEGADPSYNNWVDIDRLLQTLTHIAAGWELNFKMVPLVAVGAKHGNPCGAAVGSDSADVMRRMAEGDARALFGGLVMLNFELDQAGAEALKSVQGVLDGIVAPGFTPEAIEVLSRKKTQKCRFLVNPALEGVGLGSLNQEVRFRQVRGAYLRQPNYTYVLDLSDEEMMWYGNEFSDQQRHDVVLAWAIGSTSNSNTISLVRNGQLIGNGVGQQDRVSCCELAIKRAKDAGHEVRGAASYSDSFFPFPDGPEALIKAGATAMFATSGSVKDAETQALCQKHGLVLCQLPDTKARGFYGH